MLEPIKGLADVVIDSTGLKAHMLRRRIADEFLPRAPTSKLAVSLESFGFKHGPARDADMVLDVRFLPNPHYEPELRPLTGRTTSGSSTTSGATASSRRSTSASSRCWTTCCRAYVAEGKAHLTIASAAPAGATARWRSPSTSRAAGASATTSSSRSPIATSRWPTAATATAARPEPRELTYIT